MSEVHGHRRRVGLGLAAFKASRVDINVGPDAPVSHLIVGTPGGFLGLRRHEVAVPVSLLLLADDKFGLVGPQPGSLQLLPAFDYAR